MPLSERMLHGSEWLLLGMALLMALTALSRLLVEQMSRFCARWEPLPTAPPPQPVVQADQGSEEIAAIGVAIHLHRTRLRRGIPMTRSSE